MDYCFGGRIWSNSLILFYDVALRISILMTLKYNLQTQRKNTNIRSNINMPCCHEFALDHRMQDNIVQIK